MRKALASCQLTSPAAKASLLQLCRFRAREPYPKRADPSPNNPRRSPNSREGVLQIEAAWEPARPANAKLGSAPRDIADAARESTATWHKELCGAVDGTARVSPSLHRESNCTKLLTKHESDRRRCPPVPFAMIGRGEEVGRL
jgi:hypothetical protein